MSNTYGNKTVLGFSRKRSNADTQEEKASAQQKANHAFNIQESPSCGDKHWENTSHDFIWQTRHSFQCSRHQYIYIYIFKGQVHDMNDDRWGVFDSTLSVQQFKAPSMHCCRGVWQWLSLNVSRALNVTAISTYTSSTCEKQPDEKIKFYGMLICHWGFFSHTHLALIVHTKGPKWLQIYMWILWGKVSGVLDCNWCCTPATCSF